MTSAGDRTPVGDKEKADLKKWKKDSEPGIVHIARRGRPRGDQTSKRWLQERSA